MSGKTCSSPNCSSTEIVAMQRQIKVFVWPSSDGGDQATDQSPPGETIEFQYFCKDHFDRNVIRKKKVKLLPAQALKKCEDSFNQVVYSYSRKRRANDLQKQTKQIKANETGKSYTLHEATNSKDNTKVHVSFNEFKKFDSDEYEDSEPTFVGAEESQSAKPAEDNDCVITADPTPTIIDLSDDENPDGQEGSNKMIDLILCNDIEPEPSLEEAKEYEIEITNEEEDQECQQPLRINFTMFSAHRVAEDDASESIDLTDDQNHETVNGNDDGPMLATIDLTDERMSNEDNNVDRSTNAVIDQITKKLNSRYPRSLQAITWNDETKQFEIIISKKSGCQVDQTFHQYLREVVNQAIQYKSSVDRATELTNQEKTSDQLKQNIILNKEYSSKQLEMFKRLEANKKTANAHRVNTLNGDPFSSLPVTSSPLNTSLPVTSSPLSGKTQIVSNYNANQILKKSESYLGVKVETFQRIERLLNDRFNKRSVLILVLRKIKLNEPFAILSDVLCSNKDDCIKIYKQFLVEVSRTLQACLRWPTADRWEPMAIVDVFEIEIEKPNSFVEQSVSFCSQSQRYTVKFIVCCTSAGYITHLSQPYYTIQGKILISCLDSIPKCCSSVVVNPNLLGKQFATQRASLFDCSHQAERNLIRGVFDRLRRFSLLNSVSDAKHVNLLHRSVSLVACLLNMEMEAK